MVDLPIQVMQHEAPTKHETLKLAQRKQIRSEKIHRRERNEELDSECRKKEFEERRLSETASRRGVSPLGLRSQVKKKKKKKKKKI